MPGILVARTSRLDRRETFFRHIPVIDLSGYETTVENPF
jgi:hypothetical protein